MSRDSPQHARCGVVSRSAHPQQYYSCAVDAPGSVAVAEWFFALAAPLVVASRRRFITVSSRCREIFALTLLLSS